MGWTLQRLLQIFPAELWGKPITPLLAPIGIEDGIEANTGNVTHRIVWTNIPGDPPTFVARRPWRPRNMALRGLCLETLRRPLFYLGTLVRVTPVGRRFHPGDTCPKRRI